MSDFLTVCTAVAMFVINLLFFFGIAYVSVIGGKLIWSWLVG